MYHLYYSAGSCSMAIHIALREMGMEMGRDFDLIDTSLNAGKNRSAEFLALNPRGQVPVLVEDGQAIREGGAILVYLLDKHQNPLLPREGFARAQALQALMWGNATMHPAYSRYFWLSRNVQDEAQRQALLTAFARAHRPPHPPGPSGTGRAARRVRRYPATDGSARRVQRLPAL